MAENRKSIKLTSLDDLFSTEESRTEADKERIQDIPIAEIDGFPDHPFHVDMDDAMSEMVESVKRFGVLSPAVARQKENGRYELISGHRRKKACELAGIDKMPVIVRNMDRDEAIIFMVDSNLQRERLLPSEKAFSYKMKMEALKRQGNRSDLTSTPVVSKLRTNEQIGQTNSESREQVRRYIRLTELTPALLQMVDDGKIAFRPAVELSYLDEKQQQDFLEAMDASQNAPSLSQAIRIKKLAQQGEFDYDAVYNIMNEEKKSELDTVTIKNETLRKYFPRNYTPRQMESIIIKLLDQWQLKKQQAKQKKQEEAR